MHHESSNETWYFVTFKHGYSQNYIFKAIDRIDLKIQDNS